MTLMSEGGALQVSLGEAPLSGVYLVKVWRRGEEQVSLRPGDSSPSRPLPLLSSGPLQTTALTLPPEETLLLVPALQAGGRYCARAYTLLGGRLSNGSHTQCVTVTLTGGRASVRHPSSHPTSIRPHPSSSNSRFGFVGNRGHRCGDCGRHGNPAGGGALVHVPLPPAGLPAVLPERAAAPGAGRCGEGGLGGGGRQALRLSLLPQQSAWDARLRSSAEEAEPLEAFSMVMVVLSTERLLRGGAASSL